jgi:hypothetical protein
MSANDYIASLEKSNPRVFAAKEITIQISEFKRIIKLAFAEGHKEGVKEAQTAKSLFEKVFGKTKL